MHSWTLGLIHILFFFTQHPPTSIIRGCLGNFIAHVDDSGLVGTVGSNGMKWKTNGWKIGRNVGTVLERFTQLLYNHCDTLEVVHPRSLMIVQLVRCVKSMVTAETIIHQELREVTGMMLASYQKPPRLVVRLMIVNWVMERRWILMKKLLMSFWAANSQSWAWNDNSIMQSTLILVTVSIPCSVVFTHDCNRTILSVY